MDMPSRWDPSPQKPLEVSLTVVDFIQEEFNVVMCPPGWPTPPTPTE